MRVLSPLFLFLLSLFAPSVGVADGAPKNWQIWYQDAASPVMERIHNMHEMLLWIIVPIFIFVSIMLFVTLWRFREKKNPVPSKTTHHVPLEILWTLVPVMIVAYIAFPSIKLIYYMHKTEKPEMTLKVIGHQWYWEYDYPDHKITFDSYMIQPDKLQHGQIRGLDVDKQVVLPVDTDIRILAASADVLHSWAVPAFGIKQDTVPGRTRETWVRITKPGTYYGQCSELCGKDHGFMSIAVKAVPKEEFEAWIKTEGGHLPSEKPAQDSEKAGKESAQTPAQSPAQTPAQGVDPTTATQPAQTALPSSTAPTAAGATSTATAPAGATASAGSTAPVAPEAQTKAALVSEASPKTVPGTAPDSTPQNPASVVQK